ncbi:amino acid adenylation domain-containing protein [Lentzea sp. PSKA42]|uniref:Amino acid adenylation domain-containing protein n=1 Tax=Lentzea indica TaxID=2604800 RepID=A0ABX1FEG7_9PSEU|nr:amino acid adenylation domain-containing protein [Lentzea indica]
MAGEDRPAEAHRRAARGRRQARGAADPLRAARRPPGSGRRRPARAGRGGVRCGRRARRRAAQGARGFRPRRRAADPLHALAWRAGPAAGQRAPHRHRRLVARRVLRRPRRRVRRCRSAAAFAAVQGLRPAGQVVLRHRGDAGPPRTPGRGAQRAPRRPHPRLAATATGPVRPGEQHVFTIPDELWDRTAELAKSLRATPFVVLFAAYQAVLQRWSGRDEFVVGTVTANRPHAEAEHLVGFFVNTVPLRCLPRPGQTFAALCKEVRVEAFKSLTYQSIPFDQLTASGARGVVDVGFALQNMLPPKAGTPWSTPELLPTGTAKFDLILIVEDDAEGRRGRIEFATDQYSADMARRLGDNFLTLLRAAVDEPATPLATLPLTANGSVVLGAEQDLGGATSVLDVVGHAYAPDAPAVSVAGDSVSWRELDDWSWAVANRVTGSGEFVPVLAARSPALVAAWLGVLRAGAAYAPLSLDTPADRLDHVLAELDAKIVLADQAGADLIARHGTDVEVVRIEDFRRATGTPRTLDLIGQEPAVVIYTSGTTGRPKGVLVPHNGMLNTCVWWARDIDLGPGDRVLCTWSTSFDGATHEVFRALIAGAELVFADDVERRDPPALARLLREVTVTSMTPSLLRAILDADQDGPTTLRTVYVGGEGLPTTLAEECTRRWGVPMRNIYGPTEASCISTFAPVTLDGRPPAIGVPVPNTRAYVLGPQQEELPDGVPGELCVAGAGVALGYLGQPDRTEAAFLLDPLGGRMYRTGDRVVLREDGQIEYLGRVDDQVKVLGNRIELGEVRKLLEDQPSVKTAAVKAEGTPLRLVAWVELTGAAPDRDELLKPLLRWVPAAVLPSEVYVVDTIPMTGNDKMDFTALDAMRGTRLPDAVRGAVELTPEQCRAAELFGRALDRDADELPLDGDFFTLGGHSLLAVRMLADTPVALRDFLADPTVAGLGALLGTTAQENVEVVVTSTRRPRCSNGSGSSTRCPRCAPPTWHRFSPSSPGPSTSNASVPPPNWCSAGTPRCAPASC